MPRAMRRRLPSDRGLTAAEDESRGTATPPSRRSRRSACAGRSTTRWPATPGDRADGTERRVAAAQRAERAATAASPSAASGSTTTIWRPGTQNPCIVRATNVALSQPAAIDRRRPATARPTGGRPAARARTAPATTPATTRRCRSRGRRAGRRGAAIGPSRSTFVPTTRELAGLGEVVAGGVDGPAAVPDAVGDEVERAGERRPPRRRARRCRRGSRRRRDSSRPTPSTAATGAYFTASHGRATIAASAPTSCRHVGAGARQQRRRP